jgi:hypothetical protein
MKYARDYSSLTITKHHAKLVTMSKDHTAWFYKDV